MEGTEITSLPLCQKLRSFAEFNNDKVRIESNESLLPQSEAKMQLLTMLDMTKSLQGRISDKLTF